MAAKRIILGGLVASTLAAIAAPLPGQGSAPAGKVVAGERVYRSRCAGCHDTGANRAPRLPVLRGMNRQAILRSLDSGAMKAFAAGLTAQQKSDVADHLVSR